MKFAFISKGSDDVTSKNGATSVAPKKESNLISVLNRWPHRFALLSWGHDMMSCKRPHTVKATLTSEEYETLSALAEKAGMTKAELIRYNLIHRSESLDNLVSKNDDGARSKKLQPVSGDSDEKRSKVIYVKVTDGEHEAIRKRADILGATVSAYARRVMLAGKIEKIDFDKSQVAKIYRELYREGTNLNQLMYFVNAQGLPAYNEKAVFRTLEKVYQNARKVTLFIRELERRYFTDGGDLNDRY